MNTSYPNEVKRPLFGKWVGRLMAATSAAVMTTANIVKARSFWMPLFVFCVTRFGIAFIAYFAIIVLPANSDPIPYHLRGTENVFVDVFGSRWDTGFYVSIAEEGYQYAAKPFPSVPFFPLLPLLMKGGMALGMDAVAAGLLITNVALLAATILLYQLVNMQWGSAVADRTVWYLLIFPVAFFGSAIYTESLFLLGAIGALYTARRGKWWLAGLFGLATAASRLVGIIVIPMLLFEWLQSEPRPSFSTLGAIGLPLLAPLGFMLYLWRSFGDPLAFISASSAWGRVAQLPSVTIANLLDPPAQGWSQALLAGHIHVNDWFDLLMVFTFLSLSFVLLYQRRWSEGVFVWLGIMISFSSGLLMSQRRYMWVLFPIFILLARWGQRPWVDRAITTFSLLGLALFTALFANGYWVG